ncbi:Gp37-like protein [Microbacterium arborescens]|uniref:Gp37-like protein n=1 Tax=Microbacterium arborescens TaxID=33883 RepID=UPI003C7679C2
MRQLIAEFMDAENRFVGQAVAQRTTAALLWNAASTATLQLRDTHPIVRPAVETEGLRCALWMVNIDGGKLHKQRLMEGAVQPITGRDSPFGLVEIDVVDDWADLDTILGWQVPAAGASGQGAAEYWRTSGPSETRAKAAIAANVARLGLPWDVAPSLGRGSSGTTELRMHTLAEKVVEPLVADRLQLTVRRDRTTNRRVVDVRAGDTFPRPITPASGVLGPYSWMQRPATATRAVVGGKGQGVEREFALVIDHALESKLGRVIEVFVNATAADEGADLTPYGRAALEKHAAASSFSAELRETSWFRLGETFQLGDRLAVKIGALEFEDVISRVDITHDVGSGFTAVPTVGLATDDPQTQLVNYVRSIATAVAEQERK